MIGLSIYDFLNKLPTDYISYIGMLHVTIHQYLDNGNFWIINNLAENGKETNLSHLIRSNEKQ